MIGVKCNKILARLAAGACLAFGGCVVAVHAAKAAGGQPVQPAGAPSVPGVPGSVGGVGAYVLHGAVCRYVVQNWRHLSCGTIVDLNIANGWIGESVGAWLNDKGAQKFSEKPFVAVEGEKDWIAVVNYSKFGPQKSWQSGNGGTFGDATPPQAGNMYYGGSVNMPDGDGMSMNASGNKK